MTLQELEIDVVKEVEKKIGKMCVINDFYADTLYYETPDYFFGHTISIENVRLSILYTGNTNELVIIAIWEPSGEVEYYENLLGYGTEANLNDNIYQENDLKTAIDRTLWVVFEEFPYLAHKR